MEHKALYTRDNTEESVAKVLHLKKSVINQTKYDTAG